jgi:hypothetical protein
MLRINSSSFPVVIINNTTTSSSYCSTGTGESQGKYDFYLFDCLLIGKDTRLEVLLERVLAV